MGHRLHSNHHGVCQVPGPGLAAAHPPVRMPPRPRGCTAERVCLERWRFHASALIERIRRVFLGRICLLQPTAPASGAQTVSIQMFLGVQTLNPLISAMQVAAAHGGAHGGFLGG